MVREGLGGLGLVFFILKKGWMDGWMEISIQISIHPQIL